MLLIIVTKLPFSFSLNKWQDLLLKHECLSAPLSKDGKYPTGIDSSLSLFFPYI